MPLIKVKKTPLLPLLFFCDNFGSSSNAPHLFEEEVISPEYEKDTDRIHFKNYADKEQQYYRRQGKRNRY